MFYFMFILYSFMSLRRSDFLGWQYGADRILRKNFVGIC